MAKRVSIQDIAAAMQVSISTVSAVLNGKATERRISDGLRDKILAYATEIHYQPNLLARSLRTGKSHIIGMLLEDISDPFFASIAREMEKLALGAGYKIFFSSTENNPEIAHNILKTFRDSQVDAYIIAPPPGIEKEIELLQHANLPVIIFDRYLPDIETENVLVNNEKGTFEAIQHFIQQGRQKIALVTLDSTQTQMKERLNGYKKAIRTIHEKPRVLQLNYNRGIDDITPQLENFFVKNKEIDAILFTTNYLTASGLKALKTLSKQIPKDIAVIGYDDNFNFSLYTPTITAVSQSTKDITAEIFRKLQELLSGKKKAQPETTLIDTRLILRESSNAAIVP